MTSPDINVQTLDEPKDLGFGSVVGGFNEQRLLNRDGTFNSRRRGLPFLQSLSLYHHLLTISWPRFLGMIVAGYLSANVLFAFAYLACGVDSLNGELPTSLGGAFWRAF